MNFNVKPEDESLPNQRKDRRRLRWDASIMIALMAVLISSVSAYIGFKESRIMMEQQQVLTSQQEASVWPYLQINAVIQYHGDTAVSFQYSVKNKGIGPAIINEVKYLFDEVEIKQWELYQALRSRYEAQVIVSQTQNASLDRLVLAPGESHLLITEKIQKRPGVTISLSDLINEISGLYVLEYCYCSVYGKCWFVRSGEEVVQSDRCTFRDEIR